MKKSILIAILALALLAGCSTTQNGKLEFDQAKADRVIAGVEKANSVAAGAYCASPPAARAALWQATPGLKAMPFFDVCPLASGQAGETVAPK